MGKADVHNQENMAPGDPALKFCSVAAAAHERAYPAAALIQSLATSAGAGGDSFAAPKPRMAAATVGPLAAAAPPTTPTRTARPLAPLSASNLNLSVGGAGTTTPTKQQAAQCVGGEPLTPTCNLKVLVAASTAVTACEQQLPQQPVESGGFTTPKKAPCCGVEPLTPTTNLKVLVSAASADMRNLESRQEQLPPPSVPAKSQQQERAQTRAEVSSDDDDCIDDMDEYGGREDSDDDVLEPVRKKSKKEYVCRKDKSLGLLCQKFISRFDEYPPHNAHIDVSLDELAKELGVERRRIYDIVNVLESVEMMSRRAKNRYLWHGKTRLIDTLTKLKQLAEAEGMQQQLNIVREYELSRMSAEEPASGGAAISADSQRSSSVSLKQYMELFGNQMKKEKSLGIMSQKFLMLFLTSTKTINLDIAAKILIGDPTMDSSANNAKFKTKIRRLYDIANILTSLHLIRKVHVTEVRGRKPAFQYVGPSIELAGTAAAAAASAAAAVSSACESKLPPAVASGERHGAQSRRSEHGVPSAKRSLIRHSSFDTICKVAESERTRLIASQPSSPLTAVEDETGGGQKPRQYVMIQGGGPKMQVITTSQAPNFLASNVQPQQPLQPMPPQAMQRLTLIPVSSSALSTSAGHVVLRTAMVNDMTRMCHFSPVHGITPLTAVSSSASLITPYMNERHRSEAFLLDSGKHLNDACRLLPEFGSPMTTSTLVMHGGATSNTDSGSNRQDDDFQVFRPVRMMTTASFCRGKGNAGPPPAAGQTSCQQQLTPMNRGIARGRGMSSLLNPARNIGKNIDLAATEPLGEANLRTAASEYTLAAPSISEVPLTTISPVRPVASFCSPVGGGSGSLKTPVSTGGGSSLKTPVNERPPARSALYTTPGFMPFASPSASIPTAFRPVHNKTPGGSSHLYPETVRRLKLK